MGYLTSYELEVKTDNEYEIIKEFLDEYDSHCYAISELGESYQECKWYSHERELKEFTKKYIDILFVLNGRGEENDDIWVKYFKNGKVQECRAKITFEDFDESKLK